MALHYFHFKKSTMNGNFRSSGKVLPAVRSVVVDGTNEQRNLVRNWRVCAVGILADLLEAAAENAGPAIALSPHRLVVLVVAGRDPCHPEMEGVSFHAEGSRDAYLRACRAPSRCQLGDVCLGVIHANQTGTFFHSGTTTDLLIVGTGLVTAVPLLMFASAARRIPLTTVGILQYLAPTMQFLIGVFLYHEPFDRSRLVGFGIVWVALIIFWVENLMARRVPVLPLPEP
jgi:multidrug transporter EmrE-like cation transporter